MTNLVNPLPNSKFQHLNSLFIGRHGILTHAAEYIILDTTESRGNFDEALNWTFVTSKYLD